MQEDNMYNIGKLIYVGDIKEQSALPVLVYFVYSEGFHRSFLERQSASR